MKKNQKNNRRRYFVNEFIPANTLRLIDTDERMIGNVSKEEALRLAQNQSLDLVLIGQNQNPPVAKMMDFGKFIYEQDRRDRKNRARTKTSEMKELRLSFNMSEHDRDVKLNKARSFITEGHRIKLQMRLKGRENIHYDRALEMLKDFVSRLGMEFDHLPQRQGQSISVLLKKAKENETKNS